MPVELVDDDAPATALERVRAQRVAQLAHQRGRADAVPDDVAHRDAEPAAVEREHVVPVAADVGARAARHVARRDQQPGHLRQPRRAAGCAGASRRCRARARRGARAGWPARRGRRSAGAVRSSSRLKSRSRQRADLDHAVHAALDDQRDPEQRARLLPVRAAAPRRVAHRLEPPRARSADDPPGERALERDLELAVRRRRVSPYAEPTVRCSSSSSSRIAARSTPMMSAMCTAPRSAGRPARGARARRR